MFSRFSNIVSRSRPYWLLFAAASLAPALLSTFTSYLNARFVGSGKTEWGAIAFSAALWLAFGLFTPIPYVLARRYPLRHEAVGRIVVAHLSGAFVLNIAWTLLSVLAAIMLNRQPQ